MTRAQAPELPTTATFLRGIAHMSQRFQDSSEFKAMNVTLMNFDVTIHVIFPTWPASSAKD